MRRTAVIGMVLMLVVTLGACQRGKVGARCHTKDWGDDGKSWVLQCKKGRWVRAMTKAQAAQILLALLKKPTAEPATPLGVATEPSPADDPSRGTGAVRSDPIAILSDSSVGGQWIARIDAPSPDIITAGSHPSGSTATPAAGRAFVGVGMSLLCGNGAELACTDADRGQIHIRLVTGDGVEYVYTTAPGYSPDILSSSSTFGTPPRYIGWASFDIPASATDDLTVKIWVNGSTISPTYLRIR